MVIKKHVLGVLALVVLCLGFASFAYADSALGTILKRGELWVGFNSGYMPFEMTNKQGDFVGFDIDVAKEMAKAMGVKLHLENTAWNGIIPALMTDKFDIIISGMTVTQERNLQVNFADPYIVRNYCGSRINESDA